MAVVLAIALCHPCSASPAVAAGAPDAITDQVVETFSDAVGIRLAYPEDLAAGATADGLTPFLAACRLLAQSRLEAPAHYVLTARDRSRIATLLGRAIGQAPDFAAAHYLLALIRAPALRYGPSVSAYRRAMLLERRFGRDPLRSLYHDLMRECQRAADHDGRGGHFLVRGKYGNARRQFGLAVKLMPDYASARVNLGLAHMMLGDLDRALSEEEEAIRLDPRLVEGHYNLGKVYQKLGRYREAADAFREAVRLAEARGPDLSLGEQLDPPERRHQEALFLRRSAQRLASLGNALWALGDVDSSIAAYERAAELDPGLADVHYNLGIVLEAAGRPADALRHWQAFLALARRDKTLNAGIREAKERIPRLRELLER